MCSRASGKDSNARIAGLRPLLYTYTKTYDPRAQVFDETIGACTYLYIRKRISAAVNLFNLVRGSGFEVKRSLARGPINSTVVCLWNPYPSNFVVVRTPGAGISIYIDTHYVVQE